MRKGKSVGEKERERSDKTRHQSHANTPTRRRTEPAATYYRKGKRNATQHRSFNRDGPSACSAPNWALHTCCSTSLHNVPSLCTCSLSRPSPIPAEIRTPQCIVPFIARRVREGEFRRRHTHATGGETVPSYNPIFYIIKSGD